jgi:FMN phosphatase YigB (HAD superfamily)
MNVRMPDADGTHRLGGIDTPAYFDDTTPAHHRPPRADLEPETIVHDAAMFNAKHWAPWDIDTNQPLPVRDVMFDIDDVLCPTIDMIHDLAHKAGLHDGTIEPAWDGAGQYGCDPQIYWDLWSDFAAAGGYVNTPPIEEAAEALRRLYFAGHRIHLVTARGFMAHASEIRGWTGEWLEEFALPWHTLTFAQDKVAAQVQVFDALGEVERVDVKHEGCEEPTHQQILSPRFDYAIDDRVKTVSALRQVGVEAYVLTHAHNRAEPADWRVDTVTEFVNIILEASA